MVLEANHGMWICFMIKISDPYTIEGHSCGMSKTYACIQ